MDPHHDQWELKPVGAQALVEENDFKNIEQKLCKLQVNHH